MMDPTPKPNEESSAEKKSSLLDYPTHVASAPIVKIDGGAVAKAGLKAMEHQTTEQLLQIREQMELLAAQARKIQSRIEVSQKVYAAKCGFKPEINHTYYLYATESGGYVLSLIGPQEWGKSKSYQHYVASVKLLGDHTWEVVHSDDENW